MSQSSFDTRGFSFQTIPLEKLRGDVLDRLLSWAPVWRDPRKYETHWQVAMIVKDSRRIVACLMYGMAPDGRVTFSRCVHPEHRKHGLSSLLLDRLIYELPGVALSSQTIEPYMWPALKVRGFRLATGKAKGWGQYVKHGKAFQLGSKIRPIVQL